jgi:hypothetical protein
LQKRLICVSQQQQTTTTIMNTHRAAAASTTTTTKTTTTKPHSTFVTIIMEMLLNKTSLAFLLGLSLGASIGWRLHAKAAYHRFVRDEP